MCVTRENVDYKYEFLKENINEIIELFPLDLPAIAKIISMVLQLSKAAETGI